MRNETIHERHFHDMLSPDVGENIHVTMGYQDYLRIINNHLRTLYGEYADWEKCIEKYFSSPEYQNCCHNVKRCEDMPILTKQQISKMVQEDKDYHKRIDQFLNLSTNIRNQHPDMNLTLLLRANEMLGILPNQKNEGLYRWLISRDGLDSSQKQKVTETMSQNPMALFLVEYMVSTLFVPGLQLTFANVGTAMVQQKGKYYYRGENAYYGSSKPGFFRQTKTGTSPKISTLINQLVLDRRPCNQYC